MIITFRVLNQRFEFESELDMLGSEVAMLQEYAAKEDVTTPSLETEGIPVPATVVKGYPRFTAVSTKSGLQFRVEDRKEDIKKRLGWND